MYVLYIYVYIYIYIYMYYICIICMQYKEAIWLVTSYLIYPYLFCIYQTLIYYDFLRIL